jgi:hypothetical protein
VGLVVEKVALGMVLSGHFGFHCQFSFHQMLHTHLSSGADKISKILADVPSRQSRPTSKIKNKIVTHDDDDDRNNK